jgi:hypothetical protein
MQDAYAWSTSPEATVSFEQLEDELDMASGISFPVG